MNSANSLTGAGIQDEAVTASVKDALRLGCVGVGFTTCLGSGPAAGRGGATGPPTAVIPAASVKPSRTVGRWPLASVRPPDPSMGPPRLAPSASIRCPGPPPP
jgi:hypothetical protein